MPSRFELANAIRVLAMDAVQAAKSGHPGAPMGLADVAEVLCEIFLSIIRRILNGPTATALYCRTATAPCCCTRYCT